MEYLLRASRSREDSRQPSRLRRFLKFKPAALEGYSINRILLFGLILPALVALGLFLSLYVSLALGFPGMVTFLLTIVGTFVGFTVGTVIIIHLSDRIIRYAEVKKKC